ncbi:MAG: DUF4143 domain-containing protein [Actinobacteria bacterium]|nr:DUF4143 domain-containing protein [Actinomycetota bacterium]MCG2803219.1 DUF4143 domain-containing protein [Cellulomonas sp.]
MSQQLTGMVARRVEALVAFRLPEEQVILLEGPRSVGKSTLLRAAAAAHRVDVLDLDDLATRDAAAADPALFVAGPSPVCVDEYQHVPAVLDALNAELNRDGRPGRFLLTGSTRHTALPTVAQALTGRLHRIPVLPLSQGEIAGVLERFLADLLSGDSGLTRDRSTTSRDDYINRVVAGGFPLALQRGPAARNRWFDDYTRLTLERDVRDLSRLRQGAVLPALTNKLAGQTAQVLNITAAAAGVGLDRATADSYVRLLEAVFLIHRLPVWGTTLTARSSASPKIHLVDLGVAARLLRLTPAKLSERTPSALTEFGHLLETFVVGELLKQASWIDDVAVTGHWRTHDNDEVDLVVEKPTASSGWDSASGVAA